VGGGHAAATRALCIGVAGLCIAACGHRTPGDAAAWPAAIRGSTTLGGLGDTPGRFGCPRALDADCAGGGSLWVVDKTARVQRIDPVTGRCLAWWRMPEYELGKPVGVTVVPSARAGAGNPGEEVVVYIPDTHYSRVMVYSVPASGPNGAAATGGGTEPVLVRRVGTYGTEPGQFIYPTDVAVLAGTGGGDRPDRIYVSEYGGNDRVSVFDGDWNFKFSFGSFGSGDGSEGSTGEGAGGVWFNRPQSICLVRSAGGQATGLLVADSRNHRLGRFTLDGALVRWYGSPESPGDGPGQFCYPNGVFDLGDGTALVAEYGNNRVQRVDLATGTGLGAWGRPGRGEGELATPWAVTVLGDRTFVLDTGNNRVVAFPTPK
jgi:hypothetical protein